MQARFQIKLEVATVSAMAFNRQRSVVFLSAIAIIGSGTVIASAQQAANKPAKAARQSADAAAAITAPQTRIDEAGKLMVAGKFEPAIAVLSTVISAGNLPANVMARALYLRGRAYRQQAKPALAIADLTSALWLKAGLSDVDRADATQQRAAAYNEAGLTDQGEAIAAGRTGSRKVTPATAAAAPAPPSASGGTFADLAGGPQVAAPAPPKSVAKSAGTGQSIAPTPAVEAPSASVLVARAPMRPATPKAAVGAPASAAGQFQARVALVRSRAEADTVVAKLKVQHSAELADHRTHIGEATFGS